MLRLKFSYSILFILSLLEEINVKTVAALWKY